jgi:tRNA(Arg) A34 adenosine deaminase TadA
MIKRRDMLLTAAGAAGSVLATVPVAQGEISTAPPPDLDPQSPLWHNWEKPVHGIAEIDLAVAAPELDSEPVKERHRIYAFLLMTLIRRFWNGNNSGPIGIYPWRDKQKEPGQNSAAKFFRYRGDVVDKPDRFRVNWDRYLGHNIGCLAVDGNGEIIDFDFNHNNVFRSSSEHAEARIVRRLFSLADIFDNWKTGRAMPGKSRAFSLQDVTIYTSLESCAQCSGMMSLGRVKQVVYLQNDPGAYRIGNIMFNLAGRDHAQASLAPLPIKASAIGMTAFTELNTAFAKFQSEVVEAGKRNDLSRAFFVPPDGLAADYAPSITSFLCTDDAYSIFAEGADQLRTLQLWFPKKKNPNSANSWTNEECLTHARRFYTYADVEGYRGTPHKL